MALDPSILFQAKPAETPDLLGAVGNFMSLKNAKRQGDIQDIQLKTAKEEQANKQILGDLFAKHTTKEDGKPKVDNDAIMADLFSMGKGDLALKFDEDRTKHETDVLAHETALKNNDIAALKLQQGRTEAIASLARGALDLKDVPEPLRQQGWETFKKRAAAIDPTLNVDNLPQTYDENFLKAGVTAGLTEEEALKRRIQGVKDTEDKAFQAAIPALKGDLSKIGRDQTKLNLYKADILAKYPNSDLAKRFTDGIKIDVAPNVSVLTSATLTPQVADNWAARLVSGEVDPQQFYNSIPARATNKNAFIDQVLTKAKELDPSFNLAQAKIGFKQAENVQNQRVLTNIRTLKPNLSTIVEISNKLPRGSVPEFNKLLAGARLRMGNTDVTDLQTLIDVVGEETGNILGGGTGSDFKIKFGKQLYDGNFSPKQFSEAVKRIQHAVDLKEKSAKDAMGKYRPTDPVVTGDDPEKARRELAAQALNDPEATAAEKAAARKILGMK